MNKIPTLSDLLRNHWREEEGNLVWYWGPHWVLNKERGVEKTYVGWECPKCGEPINLTHTPQEFTHCDDVPVDPNFPLSLYCRDCQKAGIPDASDAYDYDHYTRILIFLKERLPYIPISQQDEIKKQIAEIKRLQDLLRDIEKRNGWNKEGL